MSYYPPQQTRRRRGGWSSGLKIRLLIGGAILLFSVFSYMSNTDVNPVTGKKQRVGNMSVEEEIMMGLRAAPDMAAQHGGLSPDEQARYHVKEIGSRLLNTLETRLADLGRSQPYRFDFHLLADRRTVNAFALPGGQVFITEALYRHLDDGTVNHDGRIAGVLGHEIGHVLERHSAERMAKGGLMNGIIRATGVAGGGAGGQAAASLGDLMIKKYGREDELESDKWGVQLMIATGYKPSHLYDVMDVLEKTAGGGETPEFLSTHPRPANRREYIENIIRATFPNGEPRGLR